MKNLDSLENNFELAKLKLFVTVGNGKFEALVKEVDRLVAEGILGEEVVIQIGHGEYEPKNCKWYRFKDTLKEDEKLADVVICHGGPGTVFELLRMEKKIIAVPNRERSDPRHQVEFLEGLYEEGKNKGDGFEKSSYFVYCAKVNGLESSLEKLKVYPFKLYKKPEVFIGEEIKKVFI